MKTYTDISVQLLEDSAQDIGGGAERRAWRGFWQGRRNRFVNGTGIKQPRGIMVHPSVQYSPGGDAALLTANGLIDLFHAVPPAYRQLGAWMMNSTTVGAVRKLVTTTGAPLWVDSLAVGNPATILGRPVIEAIDMPDIASNAYPVVFGNFNQAYRIYDRVSLTIASRPVHSGNQWPGSLPCPSACRRRRGEGRSHPQAENLGQLTNNVRAQYAPVQTPSFNRNIQLCVTLFITKNI